MTIEEWKQSILNVICFSEGSSCFLWGFLQAVCSDFRDSPFWSYDLHLCAPGHENEPLCSVCRPVRCPPVPVRGWRHCLQSDGLWGWLGHGGGGFLVLGSLLCCQGLQDCRRWSAVTALLQVTQQKVRNEMRIQPLPMAASLSSECVNIDQWLLTGKVLPVSLKVLIGLTAQIQQQWIGCTKLTKHFDSLCMCPHSKPKKCASDSHSVLQTSWAKHDQVISKQTFFHKPKRKTHPKHLAIVSPGILSKDVPGINWEPSMFSKPEICHTKAASCQPPSITPHPHTPYHHQGQMEWVRR